MTKSRMYSVKIIHKQTKEVENESDLFDNYYDAVLWGREATDEYSQYRVETIWV